MPEVISFVISEGVRRETVGEIQLTNIINPIQILAPVSIPSNYSFFVSLAVYGINESKKMQLIFKSPNDETVYDIREISLSNIEHGKVPEEYRSVIYSFDIRNMPINEEGIYRAEIYVDDILIGTYRIPACVY